MEPSSGHPQRSGAKAGRENDQGPASLDGLTFRKARPGDTERIAEIMHGEPLPEAVGLCFGSVQLARALGYALVRLPGSPQGWEHTVLAALNAEPVGVLQASGDQVRVTGFTTPGVVLRAIRIFGLAKALRGLPRIRARARLNFDHPPGAYSVHELHVDPRDRNRGIGGALLEYAEEQARRGGHERMALTTTTSNPARRLYERHGFRVVETRTDPAYEKYAGIAGRHLLVKELS